MNCSCLVHYSDMSWILENSLSKFQHFIVTVLKYGPIPRHVGIIMDGNRRYAKKINAEKHVGHLKGFDKLSQTLEWCKEMGIKEVTVYAFSIENFKRTPKEVDELISLATEKFQQLLEETDKLMSEGICVRVVGDLQLLSKELKKLISKVMLVTKDNTKSYLNIAFAYTSRDEISCIIKDMVQGVKDSHINIDDISESFISKSLFIFSNPDLLIRSSGEVRVSDFLLWQISHSIILFSDVLWPEFSFWDFALCILKYQKSYNVRNREEDVDSNVNDRVDRFLTELSENRLRILESYISDEN